MQTIGIGTAGQIEVDESKFNDQVKAYIFNYGLKQILNDVHASVTAKVEADESKRNAQKLAMSHKKLDSLYAGEVAVPRAAGGSAVDREMTKMAEATLKAKLAALGKKVKDFDKAVWAQVVAKQVKANEAEYRAAAEAKLAIKPEEADFDIMALLDSGAEEMEQVKTEE